MANFSESLNSRRRPIFFGPAKVVHFRPIMPQRLSSIGRCLRIGVNTLSRRRGSPLARSQLRIVLWLPGPNNPMYRRHTNNSRGRGGARQAAVFRFHRRQYCTAGREVVLLHRQARLNPAHRNAGWKGNIGPALFIPLDGGDPASFYDDALSISCLVFEKRFYCTASWETTESGTGTTFCPAIRYIFSCSLPLQAHET
jgi:hypothetical protein